ncbi:galactan beta-1,4-galactosyltransferase gals2 [Plakobranchus ocellatus]|uniref:Glycosyltransferase family 92 protein n=1 Tax=Plakobranchus ocellatus TaxID=259542 RepID=A0AAV4B3C5_9GAST|nr:galactan beta-1,4-galactosyltransferase gals2 [Plakobranchus ocellatus]
MSRLLGACRVVLYNNSIGPNVDAVLRWYIREWEEGRDTLEVAVHSWKLPRVLGQIVDTPYYAQLACIDDCLHRYRWTTKYTEFSDLDEFIIPLHHEGWTELLSALEKQNPGNAGFMFCSTVFVKDRPILSCGFEEEATQCRSSILGYIQRENRILPQRDRGKLIVHP